MHFLNNIQIVWNTSFFPHFLRYVYYIKPFIIHNACEFKSTSTNCTKCCQVFLIFIGEN